MKRHKASDIVVKYSTGLYQGRVQTSLLFSHDYVGALRAGLDAVRSGRTQVEIIQFRDVIHSHYQLADALNSLSRYSSDKEVVEQVHHSSCAGNWFPPVPNLSPVVWASF